MRRLLHERVDILQQQRQEELAAAQELARQQQAEHPILQVGRLAREVAALATARSLPIDVKITVTEPIMEKRQSRFSSKEKEVQVGVKRREIDGWDVEHEITGLAAGIARDGSKTPAKHHLRGKLLAKDGELYDYASKPVHEDYQAMRQIFGQNRPVRLDADRFVQEADGEAASRMTPEPVIESLLDKLAAFAVDRHLVD